MVYSRIVAPRSALGRDTFAVERDRPVGRRFPSHLEERSRRFHADRPYAYPESMKADSNVRDRVGVTLLPAGDGRSRRHADTLGGFQLMVSRTSKHKEGRHRACQVSDQHGDSARKRRDPWLCSNQAGYLRRSGGAQNQSVLQDSAERPAERRGHPAIHYSRRSIRRGVHRLLHGCT